MICNKMEETTIRDNDYFLVLFSKKIMIPLKKKTTLQNGFDIDGNGNLKDSPRLVFIDEECENLNVVADGGELIRNSNKKKKPVVLQGYRCPLCDKC